jgi:hypothetical protein
MDQDPRLLHFIEATLALLERMQHTPGDESKKPGVHTFSVYLLEAKNLLIGEQAGPMVPMRKDVRDLVIQIKRGILEFLRFFEIHSSDEYKAFIAAKKQIDEFLTEPRAIEFINRAMECIEYLLHLPDANSIQMQLHDLRYSLLNHKYKPERAYEEHFVSVVEGTTNDFARFAGLLPDFAASDAYKAFCPTAFQVGLFLAGLPSVPQS